MAAFNFEMIIGNLNEIGFYDFLLPFIFFTTLIYALTSKINLFDEGREIDTIMSVAIGFFIVNYTSLGTFLAHLFSVSGAFIALGLVLILISATLGVDLPGYVNKAPAIAVMLAVVVGLFVLLETGFDQFLGNIDSVVFNVILLLLIIVIVFIFMARRPDKM